MCLCLGYCAEGFLYSGPSGTFIYTFQIIFCTQANRISNLDRRFGGHYHRQTSRNPDLLSITQPWQVPFLSTSSDSADSHGSKPVKNINDEL